MLHLDPASVNHRVRGGGSLSGDSPTVFNGGDLEVFVDCVSRPTTPQHRPECQDAGFDGDGHVDAENFETLHWCYGGAALPPGR